MKSFDSKTQVKMRNARELEKAAGLSKKDFFKKYGFVVLNHHSTMTAEDWLASDQFKDQAEVPKDKVLETYWSKDTPAKTIYSKEVEKLARELVPQTVHVCSPAQGVRRGPGGYQVFGAAVHSDFPYKLEEWQMNENMRKLVSSDEEFKTMMTGNYVMINFWRPVSPMKGPCQDKPMCVLDPRTVDPADVSSIQMFGQIPGGQIYLGVQYNPNQVWYYYPDMTTDEVLVFKQFEHVKGEASGRMPVFHTAFHDPAAPKEPEKRCSFEYRVGCLLGESSNSTLGCLPIGSS